MHSPEDRTKPEDDRSAGCAWIDATRPAAGRWLWGMTPVERQIRELARLGVARVVIWVSEESAESVHRLRGDLRRLYQVDLDFRTATSTEQLYRALTEAEEDLLLLEGEGVYDERILAHLLCQGPGVGVMDREGVSGFHLQRDQARRLGGVLQQESLPEKTAPLWADLGVAICSPDELEHYVPSLRLTMAPLAVRVPAAEDFRSIDHLMYRRTFKGVIDAVARYGYYHLVRWLTRQLCRTELTPNLFTLLSVFSIWGAVPCFAVGHFGAGVLVAWVGVILDSVDGKLARLRLHLSDAMGAFEHIAAMPGLGLWYAATGWHLTEGKLLALDGWALVTWVLLAAFLLDKCITGGFKAIFGKELFDYRPLDAAFHLVAARRNISLALMTLGALVGHLEPAFAATAAWTLATLAFHLLRFVWIGLTRSEEEIRAAGAGS
jgi:hypothetical protein